MRPMLMMTALLLTGCPLTVVDPGPCRTCRHDCDDGFHECESCRAENCPDMTEVTDD